MSEEQRILVMGVGNILLTDEGLGVYAVNKLEREYVFPDNVRLLDGGTLGLQLLDIMMQADRLVVLDAILGGHAPGTIYRLTDAGLRKSLGFSDSLHQVDLADTLVLCELSGHKLEAVVIGMEPFDWQNLGIEPSPAILEKMPEFCSRVLDELASMGIKAEPKDGSAPL